MATNTQGKQEAKVHSNRTVSVSGSYDRVAVCVLGFMRNQKNLSQPTTALRNRVERGVEEFKRARAPWKVMVMTGGDTQKSGLGSEGQLMAQIVVSMGVPAEDIITEEEARYTIENGYFVRRKVEEWLGVLSGGVGLDTWAQSGRTVPEFERLDANGDGQIGMRLELLVG